jgi:NAD+ synthase (glutamine-hydrolysing)
MKNHIIAGAALNQTPIDWDNNLENILYAIQKAQVSKVDILCLPELCITGYGCEDLFLTDWVYEKALRQLMLIVPQCRNITVGIGVPILRKGIRYNCAALIHNGTLLGITAKQFLARDGVHYEPRWFRPWPADVTETIEINGISYPFGDVIYNIDGVKIAFEICEDAWNGYIRPGARHCAKGVDLIMNPSASHFAIGKTALREEIVIGGSELFNCAYLFANMLGNEAGRIVYDGEILIAQNGLLLQRNKKLSFKDVNLVTATINFLEPETISVPELNEDPHDKDTEFTNAITLALFDYLRKSFSRGFVLSLSGGADSSACAVLIAEMIRKGISELGMDNFLEKIHYHDQEYADYLKTLPYDQQCIAVTRQLLTCAYQGTVNSSDSTYQSAWALAKSIGANFYDWKIDEEVNSYTTKIQQVLKRNLSWNTDDIALQNIQARARSPIIWMLANINNALLITTSNRSEGDVGYATMDGDTSGSIAPIAGIDKYYLLQWLRWAQEHLNYPGLKYVNSLVPSAELRPLKNTQTDETDLMPYKVMVEIERLAIRDRYSPLEVFTMLLEQRLEEKELLKLHVIKFFKMWARNQWKRERIAPSFHIDDFNVDPRSWCRFPILSGGFNDELKALEKL